MLYPRVEATSSKNPHAALSTHLCMFSVLMLNSGSGSHVFWLGYEKVPWMNGMARKEMNRPKPMRRNPAGTQECNQTWPHGSDDACCYIL